MAGPAVGGIPNIWTLTYMGSSIQGLDYDAIIHVVNGQIKRVNHDIMIRNEKYLFEVCFNLTEKGKIIMKYIKYSIHFDGTDEIRPFLQPFRAGFDINNMTVGYNYVLIHRFLMMGEASNGKQTRQTDFDKRQSLQYNVEKYVGMSGFI